MHAAADGKCDDTKDSCYGELNNVLDYFPKHHMQDLLGNFNTKLVRVGKLGMRVYVKLIMVIVLE
jgi:hypothetical protein